CGHFSVDSQAVTGKRADGMAEIERFFEHHLKQKKCWSIFPRKLFNIVRTTRFDPMKYWIVSKPQPDNIPMPVGCSPDRTRGCFCECLVRCCNPPEFWRLARSRGIQLYVWRKDWPPGES